jgi:hypothetical protein
VPLASAPPQSVTPSPPTPPPARACISNLWMRRARIEDLPQPALRVCVSVCTFVPVTPALLHTSKARCVATCGALQQQHFGLLAAGGAWIAHLTQQLAHKCFARLDDIEIAPLA